MKDLVRALSSGCLAGFAGGALFVLAGGLRGGADFFATCPTTAFAVWVGVHSVAVYGLLFGLLGAALGALCHLLRRFSGRLPVFAVVLAILVAADVFAYLTVWWQLEVLAGLPMDHPARRPAALAHAVFALGAGVLTALVLRRRSGPGERSPRRTLAAVAVLAALFTASEISLGLGSPAVEDDPASQVVVVGLDGVTFRVLAPLLARGELPNFARLLQEGAWGSLLTYGQAASPLVWTSVATGKRVRDHGIDDFVTVRGAGYQAEPMKSFDWRARSVWNILGDFDHTVGVVNWLVSHPPKPANGFVVSRVGVRGATRTFPPELAGQLAEVLALERDYGDASTTQALGQIDRIFDVALELLTTRPLDFLALYEATTDEVEHHTWKYYQPEHFPGAVWDVAPGDVARLGSLIPATYVHVDRRLGDLMRYLEPGALLMVVSDHGQLAARRPRVEIRLDRLLAALDLTVLTARGRVDYDQSRAYTLVETPWTPLVRVNANVAGREPHGIVPPGEAAALVDELVERLASVRFEDGKPVFGGVYRGDTPAFAERAKGADVVVFHSRYTRSDRYRERTIVAGDKRLTLAEILDVDPTISGDHDHQGVIFLWGAGVRPGPIGQRVVPTAFQDVIHHLTDKIDALDFLLPLCGRLGLIERATTLDVTPTVLHALGLPVARDMAGRPLREIVGSERPVQWRDTYEVGGEAATEDEDESGDEELLERLRSLGYVN